MKDKDDERVRVLIVGDSPIGRAGLEAIVEQTERFELVGSTNLAQGPAMADATSPDAILMEARTFSAWNPEPDSTAKPPATPLTPREVEVLRMIADGASNKTIAWKLGISDNTAKFHVASILSKLDAGSRTEAVALGVRLGLIYL